MPVSLQKFLVDLYNVKQPLWLNYKVYSSNSPDYSLLIQGCSSIELSWSTWNVQKCWRVVSQENFLVHPFELAGSRIIMKVELWSYVSQIDMIFFDSTLNSKSLLNFFDFAPFLFSGTNVVLLKWVMFNEAKCDFLPRLTVLQVGKWILRARDRDRDILTRLRLGHQRPLNRRCPDEKYPYVNNNRLTEYPGTPAWTPVTSKSRVSNCPVPRLAGVQAGVPGYCYCLHTGIFHLDTCDLVVAGVPISISSKYLYLYLALKVLTEVDRLIRTRLIRSSI